MFELLVACKYLIPRWRQLSVSIISLISILVISLVVWLIVVFFSVTEGLQKNWIDKLVALTAPIRVTPTEAYYRSYYYHIDSISAAADYAPKSLGEKLRSSITDPYDSSIDEEIPLHWSPPDTHADGSLKDLVKEAFAAIEGLSGVRASDYEVTVSNIKLRLIREEGGAAHQRFLSQASYLSSFDGANISLRHALLPLTMDDLSNALSLALLEATNTRENGSDPLHEVKGESLRLRLHAFFDNVTVRALRPSSWPWLFPSSLQPSSASWQAYAVMRGNVITQIIIPQSTRQSSSLSRALAERYGKVVCGRVMLGEAHTFVVDGGRPQALLPGVPLSLVCEDTLAATLISSSLEEANSMEEVCFRVGCEVQGMRLEGEVPLGSLTLADVVAKDTYTDQPVISPPWFHHISQEGVLPSDPDIGEGILLAKSFRNNGARLGDRGYLSYYAPTTSSIQEQRLPIYVAGFYDPGIMPIGGKFITVNRRVTSLIRAAQSQENASGGNGINVRFSKLADTDRVKEQIQREFQQRGIDDYWNIETYREYDFTRDIMLQLQSEKNLFSLIAVIIIIVACSNIISMLIILVNDKKQEIGILRSMGATAGSIAIIFGLCGAVMGVLGSVVGTVAAIFTLRHLPALLDIISALQGHELFNRAFFGDMIPQELSFQVLAFVLAVTIILSLLAGMIPAVKACMLRPADILRKEN